MLAVKAPRWSIWLRDRSDRGKAAVDRYGRAGEVARLRRREEDDRLGDLGRVCGPAQQCLGTQLLQRVAECADGTAGSGGPRCDSVDTNPVGAERRCPGPREGFECRLGGGGGWREGDAD